MTITIERFSVQRRKTKTKPINYQLHYKANRKPYINRTEIWYCNYYKIIVKNGDLKLIDKNKIPRLLMGFSLGCPLTGGKKVYLWDENFAVPAALSQVGRRHMRTGLNRLPHYVEVQFITTQWHKSIKSRVFNLTGGLIFAAYFAVFFFLREIIFTDRGQSAKFFMLHSRSCGRFRDCTLRRMEKYRVCIGFKQGGRK